MSGTHSKLQLIQVYLIFTVHHISYKYYVGIYNNIVADDLNRFNNDPFAEETIITGESLVEKLSEARREKWRSLISETNMTKNSSKAWRMLRNLGNDPKNAESHINVTPNEIAHQLLKNGKYPGIKTVKPKIGRGPINEANLLHTPFTLEELDVAMARMKKKKSIRPRLYQNRAD